MRKYFTNLNFLFSPFFFLFSSFSYVLHIVFCLIERRQKCVENSEEIIRLNCRIVFSKQPNCSIKLKIPKKNIEIKQKLVQEILVALQSKICSLFINLKKKSYPRLHILEKIFEFGKSTGSSSQKFFHYRQKSVTR